MVTELAREMLAKAELAARDFFGAYEASRRGKKGNSTDTEQDLLRAMLVFAAAGLDATIKQLVRDALKPLIEKGGQSGAQTALQTFVVRRLRDGEKQDNKFLAQLLASPSWHDHLIQEWIADLTSASLQSAEKIQEVANSFGIPKNESPIKDVEALRRAFKVRNDIVHGMDLEPQQASSKARKRHQRGRDDMKTHMRTVLDVANRFICAVEKLLPDS